MSERLQEVKAFIGADRSPFQDLPRAYRWLAMFNRAMMVAFFWHEERFEKYANEYIKYIDWGLIEERSQKPR